MTHPAGSRPSRIALALGGHAIVGRGHLGTAEEQTATITAAAVAGDPTQRWADTGPADWRRMVPSPEPVRSLEAGTVRLLLDAGAVVVANGGGGVPVVDDGAGGHVGVEAALRFVDATGRPATIAHLDRAADALAGRCGTCVVAAP